MRLRRTLYRSASLLGDLHAIERGRLPQRIVRKVIYKHAFKAAGWLSRLLGVGR
jgi:hypothetical protein